MNIEQQKRSVGGALERFLDTGLDSIREAMERAYSAGHQEGFHQGCIADQDTKNGLRKSLDEHIEKWQRDRQDLMSIVPGYKYMNRVDDPEWEKAKHQILSLLHQAAIAKAEGGK